MFDLLNPLFFYVMGTIGVIVPLVLHLIHTRRTVRVRFSTTRFLRLAQERSANRIKMQNLLLWLIRTLLLVTLALAFAMPMLRHRGAGTWFGRSPRDVALVIDGSYSMNYNLGRSTVWEKAIDTAVAVVEGLAEQDRLCIFVARDHVEPVIEQLSGNREDAIRRLKALRSSQTSSDLAAAIMDANTALMEPAIRREREIHVLTDMQALPWKGFHGEGKDRDAGEPVAATNGALPRAAAASGVWDAEKIDKRTTIFVSALGVDAPENATPLIAAIEPALVVAGGSSKLTVRLGHSGVPRATTVTLQVDGKDVGVRSTTTGADGAGELAFALPPLAAGSHAVRAVIPGDNLALDDVFHLVLRVEERYPILCAGSREDTLFVRAAFASAAQANSGIRADWVEASAVSGDKLSEYASLFLCNAIPLGAGEVTAVEAFVETGGLLVVFPGSRAVAGDYLSWRCLPGLPASVEDVPPTRRKQNLHWDAPRHGLLEPLRIGTSTLTVTARRRLAWETLEARAERLASLGEAPFLLGLPFGNGYVLMFSVAADRSWSDLPLSPMFLPLVCQAVEFGAGVGASPRFVWCTRNLPLTRALPEATRETVLLGSDGTRLPMRSVVVDGHTVLSVENLMEAGIYRIADAGGTAEPALAVNMERVESDLTPINPGDLPGLFHGKNVHVARSAEELTVMIRESRVGRTLGEELLWAVLFLAAAEFFYANRLLRESPKLSDKLGADAAGHVGAAVQAGEKGGAAA